jgi:hypothetical protein
VALPFLNLMRSESARAAAPGPKRLIIWFTANGNMSCCSGDSWTPSGTQTAFTLNKVMQPLAPFQSKLLVLGGISMTSAKHDTSGDDHHTGMANQLTGIASIQNGVAGGPSIDFTLGQQVGKTTRFPSYLFGVSPYNQPMFYDGSGHALQPQGNPHQAFNALFSSFSAPASDQAKIRAQRQSVIDAVKADLDALRQRVGAEDKHTLDSHITAIRGIEQQLTATAPVGAACAAPPDSSASDYLGTGKLQMDLMAMALACDLTRVTAIQWSGMTSDVVFTQLGASISHHALSHQLSDPASVATLVKINQMYMSQLAYLLGKLQAIPEAGSTVLDNSVVFVTNELETGSHNHDNMPYLLLGGCGGTFRTGRWLQFTGRSHNDLLLSLLNAMGVNATTYGNPAYCQGPLPGLT